jgi:hypothetical protein
LVLNLNVSQAFSEKELYNNDPLLLSSEEMKSEVLMWDAMVQGSSTITEGLKKYFNANQSEFLRLLKKGLPPKYRWSAWKVALHFDDVFVADIYESLITPEFKFKVKNLEKIEMNVKEIFAEYFPADKKEDHGLLISKLNNVLAAILVNCQDIYYTQGLTYIIAFMLIVSDMNEEETFWTFNALINNTLLHDPMRMYGVNNIYTATKDNLTMLKDFFSVNFVKKMPELRLYFESIQLADVLWLQKWITEMFLGSFPLRYCLRFWDYVFGYGYTSIIQISLAILFTTKQHFYGKDYTKCSKVLDSFKKEFVEGGSDNTESREE